MQDMLPINSLHKMEGPSKMNTNEITVSGPLYVVCHFLGGAMALQNRNTMFSGTASFYAGILWSLFLIHLVALFYSKVFV